MQHLNNLGYTLHLVLFCLSFGGYKVPYTYKLIIKIKLIVGNLALWYLTWILSMPFTSYESWIFGLAHTWCNLRSDLKLIIVLVYKNTSRYFKTYRYDIINTARQKVQTHVDRRLSSLLAIVF